MSVKVDVMDEEHERCAAALTELGERRTVEALRELMAVCAAHFEHEEAILDRHLYAEASARGGGNAFSVDAGARRSHYADHARVLSAMRQSIDAATAASRQRVPVAVVKELMQEFKRHTDEYDASYADRLATAMAQC